MTDTKKLIEFLNECVRCEDSCPAIWHDKKGSEAMLKEIKGIVEEQVQKPNVIIDGLIICGSCGTSLGDVYIEDSETTNVPMPKHQPQPDELVWHIDRIRNKCMAIGTYCDDCPRQEWCQGALRAIRTLLQSRQQAQPDDLLENIRGAVARGWCANVNAHKNMDLDLAEAITQEIWKLLKEGK